jgi:hypothetical protein
MPRADGAARLRWAVRGLVAGAFVVCVAGLVSRLLPEVWPLGPDLATERLSFPLTYWNAMGLVAALGAIAAFTMSSDAEEAPLGRVLAAAALPTALLLTFSRGAILAGAAGLLVALAAGRGRGLLGALLVGVPSVGLALRAAYDAEALTGRRVSNLPRIGLVLGCLLLAVVPGRIMFSEARLDDGRAAFARGDCAGAVDSALGSIDALAVRADPYVILGYCDVRLGLPELAVRAMDGAVARDPGNWETHYGRALVLGAAGLDPRPSARRALALNPLEPLAREAVEAFATEDPQTWRRRALEARLPVE